MSFMQNVKNMLNNEYNTSVTENGAVGYRTSGRALLDLNFAVSSLRIAQEQEIIDRFIKHPLDVVSVGDIVEVQVLGVEEAKKRISLTMKINQEKK